MESAPPIPVRELFGIVVDPQIKSAQNILETPNVVREWGLPRGLVLLSWDERGWIALDYRHGTPPQVTWLQTNSAFQLSLAPSFADFVAGLRPLAELIGQDQ